MTVRTSPWPPGVPCWIDLGTPDVAAAKALYGALFDWEFSDGGPEYGDYVTVTKAGVPVAGMMSTLAMPGDAVAAWTLSIASDDLDATAAAVTGNAGTVIAPPMAIGDVGRLLVAADPTGAVFGAWQHGTHIGAGRVNEPGALVWEDARLTDPDRGREFYGAVFGWRFDGVPGAPDAYTVFSGGDPFPLGGLGPVTAEQANVVGWLPYLAVTSTDDVVRGLEAGGGRVLQPARDSPFGRQAVLADPWGATFAVIESGGGPQPDRSG